MRLMKRRMKRRIYTIALSPKEVCELLQCQLTTERLLHEVWPPEMDANVFRLVKSFMRNAMTKVQSGEVFKRQLDRTLEAASARAMPKNLSKKHIQKYGIITISVAFARSRTVKLSREQNSCSTRSEEDTCRARTTAISYASGAAGYIKPYNTKFDAYRRGEQPYI